MGMEQLNSSLRQEIQRLQEKGLSKKPERIMERYIPPVGGKGPRYVVSGYSQEFIRMNSNSYLGLSLHSSLIAAADEATHAFGVGPGAVRFIDGTYIHHVHAEKQIATFVHKPAAKIFNSAYTSNLSLAIVLHSAKTYWISDEYNHNSIIRAMRIANIPSTNRAVFKHNDMDDLDHQLSSVPQGMDRVFVIFDGVFSMRGDIAPMQDIRRITSRYESQFSQGVITIVDDSHGIGAYGDTGRGTIEHTKADADILVGTFGKAFGVNGGFIAGSNELMEAIRQKADPYIYTNPLSVADCAATVRSIQIVDSEEGKTRLAYLKQLTSYFRTEIENIGYETIDGPHPIVPVLIRNTQKTHHTVQQLFERSILAVGLTFPVVPAGEETIRIQINASLTHNDLDEVLSAFKEIKKKGAS